MSQAHVVAGKLIAVHVKEKYGSDFHARIGRQGGLKSRGGGFCDPEVASRAGAIGGRKSRRQKVVD